MTSLPGYGRFTVRRRVQHTGQGRHSRVQAQIATAAQGISPLRLPAAGPITSDRASTALRHGLDA